MQTRFLSEEEVLRLHADLINKYGGTHGLRDAGLLDSALNMPAAGFGDQYLHADLYEMGAAYLYHLARNHPFLDGNKRTALASALVFMFLNGFKVEADEDELEALVLEIAEGNTDKTCIADFFRQNSTPK